MYRLFAFDELRHQKMKLNDDGELEVRFNHELAREHEKPACLLVQRVVIVTAGTRLAFQLIVDGNAFMSFVPA